MKIKTMTIETPIGLMEAGGDEHALHFLQFCERGKKSSANELTKPLKMIKKELEECFSGKLKSFKTPLAYKGTPFQQSVWEAIRTISFGETASYLEIANLIKNPGAVRAVGTAAGVNQHIIVVPCHRVIQTGGGLGGYAGGLSTKKKLLAVEGVQLF